MAHSTPYQLTVPVAVKSVSVSLKVSITMSLMKRCINKSKINEDGLVEDKLLVLGKPSYGKSTRR